MSIRKYNFAIASLTLLVCSGWASAQSPTPAKRPSEKATATATPTPAKRPDAKAPATDANPAPNSTAPLRKVERKELTETPSTLGGEEFLFRYKMEPGLIISSEVTHLAKTTTKIDSTEQNSDSRTVSQKIWEVIKVKDGEITFEYKILEIDMSQRIGAETEIRYNSKSGEAPEVQFKAAADSVGRVISTVTIDEQGMIIARSDENNPPNLGMGDITLPVPKNPVAVGATWEIPREIRIRREDGSNKVVRFRELFKLEKVSAGVATITVRSEMLTAISEPKEEAQVLQQLSDGTIKYDLDAGRMISKELGWDKVVVGFSGAGSVMDYSARLDEQVTKAEVKLAAGKAATKAKVIATPVTTKAVLPNGETKALTMNVTPRIIIPEEEEEALVPPTRP